MSEMESLEAHRRWIPETRLEEAALLVLRDLHKVARLINIARHKSSKDSAAFNDNTTREQWAKVLCKIDSFDEEEFVPAIAEVMGISTDDALAEYTRMMERDLEPRTDLEKAWVDAMTVLYDVLREIGVARLKREAPKVGVAALMQDESFNRYWTDEEKLNARVEDELQKIHKTTRQGEVDWEVDKLRQFKTHLENIRRGDPKVVDDALEELKIKVKAALDLEVHKAELVAVRRLKVAKKPVDALVPEYFYDW